MDEMVIFLEMDRLALDVGIKIDQHVIKKDVMTKLKY